MSTQETAKQTLESYLAGATDAKLRETAKMLQATILEKLVPQEVAKADPARVGGSLKHAVGENAATMLRKLVTVYNQTTPLLGHTNALRMWTQVKRQLGATDPQFSGVIKGRIRKIASDNLTQDFIDEHDGVRDFALSQVMGELFPAQTGGDKAAQKRAVVMDFIAQLEALL